MDTRQKIDALLQRSHLKANCNAYTNSYSTYTFTARSDRKRESERVPFFISKTAALNLFTKSFNEIFQNLLIISTEF